MYIDIYIYIYIERERDIDRERERYTHTHNMYTHNFFAATLQLQLIGWSNSHFDSLHFTKFTRSLPVSSEVADHAADKC